MTKHRITRRLFIACTFGATLALTGCASAPEPAREKLTPAQVALLKDEGFKLTDNGWELGLPDKLLFGFDEDIITPDRESALLRLGRALHDAGIEALRIDGHTDDSGSADHNQQLSVRRAEAVARVMASCGFGRDHLQVRGMGKSRPIADNRTAAGRAENRRVAIIVTID